MNSKSSFSEVINFAYYGTIIAFGIHQIAKRRAAVYEAKRLARIEQETKGKKMMAFHKAHRQKLLDEEFTVNART